MSDTAAISVALNAQVAQEGGQWVHLIPAGQFSGRDGRGPWRVDSPAGLIAATRSRQGSALPVDYEHQTDHAPSNGQAAPAAGWIKELASRADGIWGRIEWTSRARAHIDSKEYRFISPVFTYRPGDGEITTLLRAGLTNNPNLELVALAHSSWKLETDVDHLAELRQLLGLNGSATLAEVVPAVRSLTERAAANTPDPAQWVPMEVFERATREVNARSHGMAEELAEVAVNTAIQEGKLFPGFRDWAMTLARADRRAFDAYVSRTHEVVRGMDKPVINSHLPSGTNRSRLSETDAQIARSLGHSEDEFISANASRMS